MENKMKRLYKAAALAAAMLLSVTTAGCAAQETPYAVNDQNGFTVSVRYDANGGTFTTNTSVIVDSFNVETMNKNSDGQAEIALLSPDDPARGNDAFRAVNNGHFLAGWYRERVETTDENGQPAYTYRGRWDFENDRLAVDPGGTYSAAEPQMTLYAAWVPLLEVAFYSLETGEFMESLTYDPTEVSELHIPAWDIETGAIQMYDFPERDGYTFQRVCYDAAGEQAVDTPTLPLPDTVDYETGTAGEGTLRLYVEWTAGEWYRIYTAEQFAKNASVNGCYEICADLDFAGEVWPTSLMYGSFTGQIRGGGHTIRNVSLTQTNNSKINAGLFGSLTETAAITDLALDNVCFTLKAGTRVVDSCFGLLAGRITEGAELTNVQIRNSTLQIDSACYFGVSEYSIGLVCGIGDASAVTPADITCQVVGDDPDAFSAVVNGNTVIVAESVIPE